jgi:hypothetical protein
VLLVAFLNLRDSREAVSSPAGVLVLICLWPPLELTGSSSQYEAAAGCSLYGLGPRSSRLLICYGPRRLWTSRLGLGLSQSLD